MARRRSGIKPPGGTLGSLLRTTLQQAGVVRDALERGARSGRARIDSFRADRQRQEALAELGEIVLELIRRGEIDVAELPEARSVLEHLEELDASAERAPTEGLPRERRRFDDRRDARDGRDDDDGTVASDTWVPPNRRDGRTTAVWQRPDASAPVAAGALDEAEEAVTAPAPKRGGGIQFDDGDEDEDLSEYMHPDDVPSKPRDDR